MDSDDTRYEIQEPAWTQFFRIIGTDIDGYMVALSGWAHAIDGNPALGFKCYTYSELQDVVDLLSTSLQQLLPQVRAYPDARLLKRMPLHHPQQTPRSTGLSLRFFIFRRDGYRCQICGRTAQDNVTLEVDHKRCWI